jgi:hypothetical protein
MIRMPLSWTDIRSNAIAFSREWKDESSEDAEAKYPSGTLSSWSSA